jgi:hypothetical protein
LATLKEQIADAEADDRLTAIEELKMSYSEYTRLSQGLQEKKAAVARYAKELHEVEFRGSNRHLNDLRVLIREVREENAVLRGKSNAYQLKIEKLNIEDELFESMKKGRPMMEVVEEAEVEQAELTEKLNLVMEVMQRDAVEHAAKVAKLKDIIQEMRNVIAAKLEHSTF